ncbi:MAG: hypothetical protein ACXWUG_11860 [Polyangiales bacterium]
MRACRVSVMAFACAMAVGCRERPRVVEAGPAPVAPKVEAKATAKAECMGVSDEPEWLAILSSRGKSFASDSMFCAGRANCTITRIDSSPATSRHVVRVVTGEGCGIAEYWLVDVSASSTVSSVSLLVVASSPCLFTPPERGLFTDPKTFVWYESTHGPPGPGGGRSWPHTIVLEPSPHAADDDNGRTCAGSIPVVRSVDY